MGLKRWWRRTFGKDVVTFTDEERVEAYVMAGSQIGSAVSYIYLGECVGFDALLDRWEAAEQAYSALGYRTLSIDDFVSFGGWGRSIDALVRVARKVGEKPVYHAAYYRAHFFRKVGVADAVKKALQGQASCGTYAVPSTEHLKE